ncbi:ABC transporter permease [Streptomyces sp. NPDC001339]|uniref:ABC transporter permease n=1 Tax=Streptomyces sp. NPDC001339 TaxID=3364563 RepID=UPI0036A24312
MSAPSTVLPDKDRRGTGRREYLTISFLAELGRDILVSARSSPVFLAQVVLQLLFLLYVFGQVLPASGYAGEDYGEILLPGVIAAGAFGTALQSSALSVAAEFSTPRGVEERLLSPVPLRIVAFEKICFGAVRGLFAGLVAVPAGALMLDGVPWPVAGLPAALGALVLAALAGAAAGLALGAWVPVHRVRAALFLGHVPLLVTGAALLPWRALSAISWFQAVCAANPLTYACEGLRGLLLEGRVATLPGWVTLPVLAGAGCGLAGAGLAGLSRRLLRLRRP